MMIGELPDLQQGDKMNMLVLVPQQHFTKPIARFSEASLVKELEKRGIGRPINLCVDYLHDSGPRLCAHRKQAPVRRKDRRHVVTDRLAERFH